MPKSKTAETSISVNDFINVVQEKINRKKNFILIEAIKKLTGVEAKIWGLNIVSFSGYHDKNDNGHQGDSPFMDFHQGHQDYLLPFSKLLKTRRIP